MRVAIRSGLVPGTIEYAKWLVLFPPTMFFASAIIFILDFRFTRGFATGMRQKQAALEAAISVAEEVGVRLAEYDTLGAGALADGAEADALPPRMRDALRRLVANLQEYRPS
eukprot:gene2236-biopygen6922